MGGRQHWVMLVDEATKYKKSFFLKKKNEQVEPIIDWTKALKARHKIQVKIIRCDYAGENKDLERDSDKNVTEVWILRGICPLKDEWVFGCSLKTRLANQTKDSTTEVVMVK